MKAGQVDLFGHSSSVDVCAVDDAVRALAQRMPPQLRLGTSSWFFPGWRGLVWDRATTEQELQKVGLAAYAKHPLLRTVCVDAGHYRPLSVEQCRRYASQVDDDFRFVVKGWSGLTTPRHLFGDEKGKENPLFLDPAQGLSCTEAIRTELGPKLGVLLFQFADFDVGAAGGANVFFSRLHRFLDAFPRERCFRVAIELRTASLITPALRALLADVDVDPCLAVQPGMPPIHVQGRTLLPEGFQSLVMRWNLNRAFRYDEALARHEPFDRIVDDDPETRFVVAGLCAASEVPTYLIANNKAEGSAPLTLLRLAREIASLR